VSLLPALVFCLVLAAAAASDLATYRIPNILPAALAVAGLLLAAPHGWPGWAGRGLSVGLVSAVTLLVYARGALGGGDVKLLIAAAVWMPAASLPQFLMPLALIGGLQALATLGLRMASPASAVAAPGRMPYGLSIALAGVAWLLARAAS
jgi:prepilin peptidase CpaA